MKKKYFSSRLFWESFKQLRIIGIMATVILTAFAAIIPFGDYLSNYKSFVIENGVQKTVYSTSVVTALDIQPLMLLTYLIITPFLVLYAFHFLNKRNACDFYHSIPETRSCIFFSLFAACIAWIAVILLSGTAVSLLTTAILHKYFIVNYMTFFVSLFTVFSANILMASAIAAAMTITGTMFNNLFVSGLILFVPRIFIYTVFQLVCGSVPFLVSGTFSGVLSSPVSNIIFGTVSSIFTGYNIPTMIYSMRSGLYSLLLGMIYAGAALYGFCRRKSESAGNAAASKRLSAVYRVTLAGVLSLIPCAIIFEAVVERRPFDRNLLFALFVWYFIIILVYALYELITSKKLSVMLRAWPGLLLVLLANGLILLILFGYRGHLLRFAPASDEITSIHMISNPSNEYEERNYILDRAAKIHITDQKTISILSKNLAKSIQLYNERPSDFNNYFHNERNRILAFKINTRSGSGIRRISLTQEEYHYIMDVLEKNKEYRTLFYTLPEKNISLSFNSFTAGDIHLTEAQIRALYKLYLQDIQSIPIEQQIKIISGEIENSCGYIRLEFSEGFYKYSLDLEITAAHTKTINYIHQWIYDTYADNRTEIIRRIRDMKPNFKLETLYIDPANVINAAGETAASFSSDSDLSSAQNAAMLHAIADFLESCPDQPATADGAYLDVSLEIPEKGASNITSDDGLNDVYINYTHYFYRFALPSNQLPEQIEKYFEYYDTSGNEKYDTIVPAQ